MPTRTPDGHPEGEAPAAVFHVEPEIWSEGSVRFHVERRASARLTTGRLGCGRGVGPAIEARLERLCFTWNPEIFGGRVLREHPRSDGTGRLRAHMPLPRVARPRSPLGRTRFEALRARGPFEIPRPPGHVSRGTVVLRNGRPGVFRDKAWLPKSLERTPFRCDRGRPRRVGHSPGESVGLVSRETTVSRLTHPPGSGQLGLWARASGAGAWPRNGSGCGGPLWGWAGARAGPCSDRGG